MRFNLQYRTSEQEAAEEKEAENKIDEKKNDKKDKKKDAKEPTSQASGIIVILLEDLFYCGNCLFNFYFISCKNLDLISPHHNNKISMLLPSVGLPLFLLYW